jgi:ammonia channel protein AmtB
MLTKRAVTGLIATAMAASAFVAGLTAITPSSYYSTNVQAATPAAALGSLSTSSISPNTVHDI